jgi:predicted transposase/invertase (TIGR01784 family)
VKFFGLHHLDVRAKDERGDIFVVEFLTSERTTFADRMTYYGSRAFGGQMLSGDPYSLLKAVIAIVITTFEMFRQLKSIHNTFLLTAKADPSVVLTHLLQMHILEATKEKIDRVVFLPPALAAWMNFIYYSHLKSEAEMSTLLNGHPMVELAYEKYQEFNHDERLRALDEAHQRFLHDLATDIEAAHEKGKDEGRVELIETLLRILVKNFGDVPPLIHDQLCTIYDLKALGRLTSVALDCQSLAEFEAALK